MLSVVFTLVFRMPYPYFLLRSERGDRSKGEGRGRGAGRPPKQRDESQQIFRGDKRTIYKKEKLSL